MNKTYHYQKLPVLCSLGVPTAVLVLALVTIATMIVGSLRAGTVYFVPFTGFVCFFVLLLAFTSFLIIKIMNLIKTIIEITDRGLLFKTMLKADFVPWAEIAEIRRVTIFYPPNDLLIYPSRPIDLQIRTKKGNKFDILSLIAKENGMDGAIDEVATALQQNTDWRDSIA